MRDSMAGIVTTISFTSSAIFLFLTFNEEIMGIASTKFLFITPFVAGILSGIGICLLFLMAKSKSARMIEQRKKDKITLKEARAIIERDKTRKGAPKSKGKKRRK